MNIFVRSITIAALSLCCVQSISPEKQPVRARKQDPIKDTKKVTVIISNEAGTSFIKDSIFTKNTDGFAKKLHFDWDKDPEKMNKITVSYKKGSENKTLEKTVTQEEAPEKSEIVIDTLTDVLYIDPSKATHKTQASTTGKKVSLLVEVPKGTDSWELFSGPTNLTVKNVRTGKIGEPLLGHVKPGEDAKLEIYEDKPTKIYVENKSLGIAKLSTLRESAIKKAQAENSDPVITIDEKGRARILSRADYEKAEKERLHKEQQKQIKTITATVTRDMEAPGIFIGASSKDDIALIKDKIKNNEKINMPNAKLPNVNLSYTNLSGAILTGADLSQEEIPKIHYVHGNIALRNANLTNADLSGANLTNVNFYDATLTRTNLTNANLSGADFKQVIGFNTAILTGADLSNATGLSDEQIAYAIAQRAKNVPQKLADRMPKNSSERQALATEARKKLDESIKQAQEKFEEDRKKATSDKEKEILKDFRDYIQQEAWNKYYRDTR